MIQKPREIHMGSDRRLRLAVKSAVVIMLSASLGLASGDTGSIVFANLSPVDLTGMGKLRIGMSLNEVEKATGRPLIIQTPSDTSDSPTCYYARPKDWPSGISMMILGKKLARIDVESKELATREGLRIGDPEAAVYTSYTRKGMIWSTPHHYVDGKYLLVHSVDGKTALLFETDNLKITSYRVGTVQAVQYVEGCS